MRKVRSPWTLFLLLFIALGVAVWWLPSKEARRIDRVANYVPEEPVVHKPVKLRPKPPDGSRIPHGFWQRTVLCDKAGCYDFDGTRLYRRLGWKKQLPKS